VANDAIELNQVLSSTKDTTRLVELGKAMYLQDSRKFEEAIESYINLSKGSDGLALYGKYFVADLSLMSGAYGQAVEFAELIREEDILSPMAERASLIKGKAYLAMGQYQKSLDTFKRFMMDYPDSIHIEEVRNTARELKSEL
jgi:tetratricopeptide (TPR) repeat protein